MNRARLAVLLLLSANLCGCMCYHCPGGGPFGLTQSAALPGGPCDCGCGNAPPLAGGVGVGVGEGPFLANPNGAPILNGNGSGLGPQPGVTPLEALPRLRPQPLAQPMPSPP